MTGPDIEMQAPAAGDSCPVHAEDQSAAQSSDRQPAAELTADEQRVCDMATD